MKTRITFLIFSVIAQMTITLANATTYYSKAGTDPVSVANWNSDRDGSSGTAPANFTTAGDVFIIQGTANAPVGVAHNLTTGGVWTLGASNTLEIESGATLTSAYDITIPAGSTFQMDANSNLFYSGGTAVNTTLFAGTESLDPASYIEFDGGSNTFNPTITGSFGNLKFNYSFSAATTVYLGGISGGLKCKNVTFTQSGTGTVTYSLTKSTNPSVSVQSLTVDGGAIVNGNFSTGSGYAVNVAGDVTIINGTLNITIVGAGSTSLNIGGNLSIADNASAKLQSNATAVCQLNFTGASCQFSKGSAGVFPIATALNIGINPSSSLTVTSGTLPVCNGLTIGSGASLTINDGGSVNCGTNAISGAGTFNLNSGAILQTQHASGVDGSVTVATKNLDPAANYIFNGTAAQTTGTLLATAKNLTINNAAGVTLSSPITVNGILTMTTGTLTLGSNNLTIGTLGSITDQTNIDQSGTGKIIQLTTGLEENKLNAIVVLTKANQIIVKGLEKGNMVAIFNAAGQELKQIKAQNQQVEFSSSKGIYIVKVTSGNQTNAVKVIL